MLTGPACARYIEEFESILDKTTSSTAHYEEVSSLHTKFGTDVRAFVDLLSSLGTRFVIQAIIFLHCIRKR